MIKTFDFRNNTDKSVLENLAGRGKIENYDVVEKVKKIIEDVKTFKDRALFEYTEVFDNFKVDNQNIKVSKSEIEKAYKKVEPLFLEILERAIKNITEFHIKQKSNTWSEFKDGIIYGQIVRPLSSVGLYVPGGNAGYPSTVLMNAIPAKIAGVERIVIVSPVRNGLNPYVLVAADKLGISEIYKIGGAQAISALAFGTESIPKVDKIVGPGNIYVATAKRLLYGYVDIDMIAGPSEILVIADKFANPKFVASDLLSQAEHDTLASAILITTSEELANFVKGEIVRQKNYLTRKEIIEKSLADFSAIIIVSSIEDAIDLANEIAPEHLELMVQNPFDYLGKVKNAGTVFLGSFSPEALGDYYAGPNHVLPTNGTARFFSPLSVKDFQKEMNFLYYNSLNLEKVKDDIVKFADIEGLSAHANSVKVRFEND